MLVFFLILTIIAIVYFGSRPAAILDWSTVPVQRRGKVEYWTPTELADYFAELLAALPEPFPNVNSINKTEWHRDGQLIRLREPIDIPGDELIKRAMSDVIDWRRRSGQPTQDFDEALRMPIFRAGILNVDHLDQLVFESVDSTVIQIKRNDSDGGVVREMEIAMHDVTGQPIDGEAAY